MKPIHVFLMVCLSLLINGCQTQATKPAEDLVDVESWKSPDGKRVIIQTPSANRTDYFDNDENRICFHFSVVGMWNPTNKPGLLVSEDRKQQVGISMLSREKLMRYGSGDLLSNAVSRHLDGFQQRFKSPPLTSQVDNIETASGKAVRWTGEWTVSHEGQNLVAVVNRWLVQVNPDWVAAVSASRGIGGEEAALQVLRTLETTDAPDCYWSRLQPLMGAN